MVWAISSTMVVLGLVLHVQNRRVPGAEQLFDPVLPGLALAFSLVGAFLTARRPRNVIGWICCSGGAVVALAFAAEQYAVYALLTEPGSLPGGRWMAWLGTWAWIPGYLALWTLLPLLFPDGQPPSSRWRPVLWAVVGVIGLATALAALADRAAELPSTEDPVGFPGVPGVGLLQSITVLGLGPVCLAGLYARYRRVPPDGRPPLAWVLVTAGIANTVPLAALAFAVLVGRTLPVGAYQAAGLLTLLSIPAAIAVGVLRHGLYDLDVAVDAVVNRVLLYGGLLAVGAGVYLVIVAVARTVTSGQALLAPSLVAVAGAGLVWRQLRHPLQRAIDRLLYRRRQYDSRVLASLGQIGRSTTGPDAILPAIVQTLAAGLKVPHVALSVGEGGKVVASAACGEPSGASMSLPLVHQSEEVGALTVSPRSAEEPFDEADRRLLDDLAAQVGIIAYALCLTADLQVSRERLVAAREEERRRLRRDLHDGLQPALAGITLGLEAVGNMVDPSGPAEALLVRLRQELQAAGADIRHLVYNLRPPALDELGLVGAIRQQAVRFSLDPEGVDVAVTAPDDLPALPAAVEVAAYRIGQEALENVRKHAGASSCEVSIRLVGGQLLLEVRDDGRGRSASGSTGVGLVAMRERAAELGGTCSVESDGGGTCVRASLPLPVA